MLGLILDAVGLTAIVMVVNQGEQVEFVNAILVALGISVAFWVAALGLSAAGTTIQFLGLVPLAALAGIVIWLTLGMTMKRSMIAGALFLVYKIAIAIAFSYLFSA